MPKIIAFFFLISIFSAQAQTQEEMLLGTISVSDLEEAPYSKWFVSRIQKYRVKDKKTDTLKTLLNGVNIKLFMGTWCSDSQRHVPRFYKIMDAMQFPVENIELVAVDREKTTPDHLERNFDIIRVPTFIFYKNNKELGRIVEHPMQSLEADMVQLLSGGTYKHAYAD